MIGIESRLGCYNGVRHGRCRQGADDPWDAGESTDGTTAKYNAHVRRSGGPAKLGGGRNGVAAATVLMGVDIE